MKSSTENKKTTFQIMKDAILYTIFGLLSICVLAVAISYIKGDQPNFFNYKFYVIQTDSMAPTYPAGSIIMTHDDASYENLPIGTTITFKFNGTTIPNTHRIVGYYYVDNEGNYDSAYMYETVQDFYTVYNYEEYKIVGYRTKGDNPECEIDSNPILYDDIISRVVSRVMFVDNIYAILQTPIGFVLIIALPTIFVFVVNIYAYQKKKKLDKIDEDLENERKKQEEYRKKLEEEAIKEYLEKQLKK